MRIPLALVLALAAAPVLADPAPWAAGASTASPAQPGGTALPTPPKPEDPVLAYYPAKARAAGVEGKAVISCTRTQHLRLDACSLVSEDPAGQGFGQAALDMAAQSPDNPKISDPKAVQTAQLSIAFTLKPPAITPDVTQEAHLRIPPLVITRPSDRQIQAAYPARAFDQEIEGEALIDCGVTLEGQLERCQLYAEGPAGYGFGQAALDLADQYRAKPGVIDGEAVSGALIRVDVQFAQQSADAPLAIRSPDHDRPNQNQAAPAWPEGGPGGPAGSRNGSIGGQSGPPSSGATPLP
ncbi:MAG TPA: TonB family protein [Caulobacteraceae bacterium]|jgi:TonB family protein